MEEKKLPATHLIPIPKGRHLFCLEGTVWITTASSQGDTLLEPGQSAGPAARDWWAIALTDCRIRLDHVPMTRAQNSPAVHCPGAGQDDSRRVSQRLPAGPVLD